MAQESKAGEQILIRGKYGWLIGYILYEGENNTYVVDLAGGMDTLQPYRVKKSISTILPPLERPYTVEEAYNYWRFGKEVR